MSDIEIKNPEKKKSVPPEDAQGRNLFQTVWITFKDGTKHGFTGKAAVFSDMAVEIVDIAFTTPKELPPGMSFEAIGTN